MAWIRAMGADSVAYHRATVLGRADDHPGQALGYYASRGETPLRWGGRVAERLGLVGAVDEASYEAIFGPGGARDPHLGTRLVATRRPGMELVVSAHKSVAVLGIIGRAEDMFGRSAMSSGRALVGWVAWARRSRSSLWDRSTRYMVETEAR